MRTNEKHKPGNGPQIIGTQRERIAFTDEIKEALFQDLSELIAIDTSNPPGKELEAAELVRARMGSLGPICSLQRFSAERANAICRIPFPGVEEGPCLIFNSHSDEPKMDRSGFERRGSFWSACPIAKEGLMNGLRNFIEL